MGAWSDAKKIIKQTEDEVAARREALRADMPLRPRAISRNDVSAMPSDSQASPSPPRRYSDTDQTTVPAGEDNP